MSGLFHPVRRALGALFQRQPKVTPNHLSKCPSCGGNFESAYPPRVVCPYCRELDARPASDFLDHSARMPGTPVATGRTRRFDIAQEVALVRGGVEPIARTRVLDWVEDPLDVPYYESNRGKSARYLVAGHDGWVWDWQLDPVR